MKAAVFVLATIGFMAQANAEEISGQAPAAPTHQSSTATTPAVNGQRMISATVVIDTSTTLAPAAAQSAGQGYSQSGTYRLDVGVSLPEKLTATARAGYSQEYSYVLPDGSSGGLIDTRLGLTKAWGEIRKDLALASALHLTLPTSRDSQRARLLYAVGFVTSATYNYKKWDFELAPKITQLFHDVPVQDNGKLNTQTSASLLMSAGYSFDEKWRLSATLGPGRSWTYGGLTRDKYIQVYELGYTINNRFAVAGGVSTDASALKSNGLEYNYSLFDQGQAVGYFDLVVNL